MIFSYLAKNWLSTKKPSVNMCNCTRNMYWNIVYVLESCAWAWGIAWLGGRYGYVPLAATPFIGDAAWLVKFKEDRDQIVGLKAEVENFDKQIADLQKIETPTEEQTKQLEMVQAGRAKTMKQAAPLIDGILHYTMCANEKDS